MLSEGSNVAACVRARLWMAMLKDGVGMGEGGGALGPTPEAFNVRAGRTDTAQADGQTD